MLTSETVRSHICIADDVVTAFHQLQAQLSHQRIVTFPKPEMDEKAQTPILFPRDEFKIEDAKAAIAEAYISEEHKKYIVMGAKSFTTVAQNALLKVLEEPPRNIEFIIIGPSKSVFLPTIRSRMPLITHRSDSVHLDVDVSLKRLDLQRLFQFVKTHERIGKHEAKSMVEALFRKAVLEERLMLSQQQLEAFDKAYRLIELNARFQSVLVMLLMTFLPEPRRAS